MTEADFNEPENKERLSRNAAHESGGDGSRRSNVLRRRRPSRKTTAVVGSILVTALVLSMAWILSGTSRPEVTIVAIVPLSGASSYLVEIQDAVFLTVEKLNRWGGINGMRIRLVVEDCGSDPELAVETLAEAEDKYHPLAVITATRGAAIPMAELAEEKGIVLISVGATAENLTEGKDWIFRYYVAPSSEAMVALEILDTLDVSSVGILHLDDVYGNPLVEMVSDAFEATGRTAESYGFCSNGTDFSEGVASLNDNEAVFVVALRHQYQAIFEELNSSGYAGHVLCGVEASIPDMWQIPEAQGTFVSAPIMYDSGAPIDTDFLEEFEERFDRPLTHQGATGSDVLRLIWGLLSDKEVSRDSLRSLLSAGFVSSGVVGVTSVAAGAHNADIPLYAAVVEGGGLRYLS